MKKAGFVIVLGGMLIASLLLVNIAVAPKVAASSEKTTAKLANGVAVRQMVCPEGYQLCCSAMGNTYVCDCLPIGPCPLVR